MDPTIRFEHQPDLNRTRITAELDGVSRGITLKGYWEDRADDPSVQHYTDLVTEQVRSVVRERDRIAAFSGGSGVIGRLRDVSLDMGMGVMTAAAGLLLGRRRGRAAQ